MVCSRDDAGTIVIRRTNPSARLRPIVCVPMTRQATVTARSVLPERLDLADVAVQASRAGHVVGALAGLWPIEPALSGDRLHEPARAQVMPASAKLLAQLRSAGIHAWLSGAGPAVAAAVPNGDATSGFGATVMSITTEHGFTTEPLGFALSGAVACPEGGCAFTGGVQCSACPRSRLEPL